MAAAAALADHLPADIFTAVVVPFLVADTGEWRRRFSSLCLPLIDVVRGNPWVGRTRCGALWRSGFLAHGVAMRRWLHLRARTAARC